MIAINEFMQRLAEHRRWLGRVGGDFLPYVDEPWLRTDGIAPASEIDRRGLPVVNLAERGRIYSDEDEKELRRLEETIAREHWEV